MVTEAAEKVRSRLVELGWNHADLARKMRERGVTVAEGLVSRWLSGKRSPGRERASVIDEVLELSVFKLWASPVSRPARSKSKRKAA